jgi:transcriptional regulator with XRE-family HTH domain
LGVTFQQIQKYERGVNRVSAARLFDICKVLNVSLSSMFERNPKAPRDPRGRRSRTRARPNSRSSNHSQHKGQGVPR